MEKSLGTSVEASEFAAFLFSYKGLAMAVSGLLTLTALIFLLVNIAKLSASAENNAARRRALQGIAYAGLSLAIFGGASVLIGVFWNIFS